VAVCKSVEKVDAGRAKWRDCGLETWRSRQRAWTSSLGRDWILERLRKELRVLRPGGESPD